MIDDEVRLRPGYSSRAIEEASVWLVMLRGPRRTREVEAGFRRWNEQDPAHAAAFEAVTSMWELTDALPRRPVPLPQRWKRAGFRAGVARAAALAASAALLVITGALWLLHGSGVATDVGGQRMLTLRDGTRVYLNTNTRIVEQYSSERRNVELKSGEALFEVAPQRSTWPFVVSAGHTEVTALGTAFVVRREQDSLSVTLVEGKVNVAPAEEIETAAKLRPQILTAGERIVFDERRSARVDRPVIEKVTAWRRGRVELDDTPLTDAVAEMNRYTDLKIRIEEPESAGLLVKGAFRAGDTVSFAQSVASTCDLAVVQNANEIVLAGKPAPNCLE